MTASLSHSLSHAALCVLLTVAATACTPRGSGSGGSADDDDDSAVDDDDSAGDDDDSGDDDDTTGDDDDATGDDDDATLTEADLVCQRWVDDRLDLSEGGWTGDVGTCDPGDTVAPGRANALRLVNLYRWLAGLPPVTTAASLDGAAQSCALIAHANGLLSHSPPSTWDCWTELGATASARSSIAPDPGVDAVDLYMADPGNSTTMGHRRWILSNTIGPIGLGSTSAYSCMYVVGGSGSAGADWTAFPSPGPFPIEAMTAAWADVDDTGWTFQSDSLNLNGAQVTVTREGQDLPVTVVELGANYGSDQALNILPQGWVSEAGGSYDVTVIASSETVQYTVEFVDCP